MVKEKSRNLSQYEYLLALQREYIIYKLRSLIYPYKMHKEFFIKIMKKKQDSIVDIAKKYGIPTIIDDKVIFDATVKSVIGESGFPNFEYLDNVRNEYLRNFDFINYYFRGSDVVIKMDDGRNMPAKVIRTDNTHRLVYCSFGDSCVSWFSPKKVTRFLDLKY